MRSLKLGFVVMAGVLVSYACGRSGRSDHPEASAGAAGGGGSPEDGEAGATASSAGASGQAGNTIVLPPPVACGIQSCKAIVLGGGVVAPCCADAEKGICGADVSAKLPTIGCQPLTQEGELDRSCPSSSVMTGGGLPLPPSPGCCSAATGQCGYWISNLGGLLPFAPGCIDAATLGGGTPQACGSGDRQGTAGEGSGGAAGESGSPAGSSGAAGAPVTEAGGRGGGGGEGGG